MKIKFRKLRKPILLIISYFVVVQLLSCPTAWTTACQASLSFIISQSWLIFMSTESVILTILSSATSFSFCPQSFPASGSFSMDQHFTSGGQTTGASASASVLPKNIQGIFYLGLTSLISWLSKELSRVLQYHSSKASILQHSACFMVHLLHLYMTTGKTMALTI